MEIVHLIISLLLSIFCWFMADYNYQWYKMRLKQKDVEHTLLAWDVIIWGVVAVVLIVRFLRIIVY